MSGRRDLMIAWALVIAATTALFVAGRSEGFTRDEGYYFQAAENHVAYYEEALDGLHHHHPGAFLDRRVIDRWFGYNSEHPPLMKTLFGISWRLLHRCHCPEEPGLHPISYSRRHRTLGLLSQGEAMRLPANLLAGLLCGAVYLFGARAWGRRTGLCAAGLTLLMPRHFFHAELSCFDAPIAAMIFLTTAAYCLAQQTGKRTHLAWTGVLAGLSIATKHNAFFLPFVLLIHSLWIRRGLLRERLQRQGGRARVVLTALASWIFAPWVWSMAVLAIPVYLLLWPWLWYGTLRRFGEYVGFHLHHVYYNIEYLGTNYNKPPFPWHYVFITTAFTVPVITLLLGVFGIAWIFRSRCRGQRSAPGLLALLGVLWPMLLIARPGTPIFGSEKHWLPAMPFLALVAGFGLSRTWDLFADTFALKPQRAAVLGWSLCALVLLPPLLEVRRSHPYGLSHYNALAGGPAGAADLGMNRQFWGYSVRGLFPYLDSHAAPGSAIYWHDANLPMLQMSRKDGFLHRDFRDSGMEEPGVRASDWALVIHEMHFNKYEYWIWDAYGTTRPDAVLTYEGVPLVTLYHRP